MIFARTVTILDTELDERGSDPQRVLAKMDLGDSRHLQDIPIRLGPWNLTRQHAWDATAALLNTDVLLSRDYAHPNLLQSVNLLVIESRNVSSFHPAPVCYEAQGWTVTPGVTVAIPVPNATWAQPHWLSEDEPRSFSGRVDAKMLEATRAGVDGAPDEKRVALYVYLKDDDWSVARSVTWIRVEMAIPPESSGMDAVPALSSLLAEAFPALFSFEETQEKTLAETSVERFGVAGGLVVAGVLAAPVAFLARTLWTRSRPGPG